MGRRCVHGAICVRAVLRRERVWSWQAAFLDDHRRIEELDYLLVATPGSGKTLAACEAARTAGYGQVIDRVRVAGCRDRDEVVIVGVPAEGWMWRAWIGEQGRLAGEVGEESEV